MKENIEYIEELLMSMRYVSQPVTARITNKALSDNWDEVFDKLDAIKKKSVEGSTSVDAITDSVKTILLEKFPGASLNRDEMANNSNVVLFKHGKSDYNTITISGE